jgi:hypothetical protein
MVRKAPDHSSESPRDSAARGQRDSTRGSAGIPAVRANAVLSRRW